MKSTRRRYSKSSLKYKKYKKYKSKGTIKRSIKHHRHRSFKHKSKRYLKQKGGSNGLIQLGYNTTRGITSTIKNIINTYIGNSLSPSPQATNSQYHNLT